uniref:Uncharacterized protein n=1 Tax=Rangifer tarandus platyrhynchus TaxID=3082113 RepID=A0ACB0EFK7_RANTA|nr:unnamed protein product [Rangifer tarandus platyrhynchus]
MESRLCPGAQCAWNLVCAIPEWSLCFLQSCEAPARKPCWPSERWGLLPPVTDPEGLEPAVGLGTPTPVGEHL